MVKKRKYVFKTARALSTQFNPFFSQLPREISDALISRNTILTPSLYHITVFLPSQFSQVLHIYFLIYLLSVSPLPSLLPLQDKQLDGRNCVSPAPRLVAGRLVFNQYARWTEWTTERWSDLPEVTLLTGSKTWIKFQVWGERENVRRYFKSECGSIIVTNWDITDLDWVYLETRSRVFLLYLWIWLLLFSTTVR